MKGAYLSRFSVKVWESLCTLAGCRETDFEEQRKRSVLALFLMIGIAVAYPFAVIHFSRGNLARAILLVSVGSLQLAFLVALHFLKRVVFIFRLNVVLMGAYFLFLIYVGDGSRLFWVLLHPMLALFLLGKREGTLWTGLLLLLSLVFLLDPPSLVRTYPYEIEIKTRFLIGYTIIMIMSIIVESTLQRYRVSIRKAYGDLEQRVEQALKNSEANYRALFEAEPDGILIVDTNSGKIVDANPSISKLYGYSHEELCGLPAVALSAEPDKSKNHIEAVVQEAQGGPVALTGYRRHRRKDGSEFPVEIDHGLYLREGRQMICAIMRDVTVREVAVSALRESEERFRELAELLPETIFEMNSQGILTFVNRSAFIQFGYTQEDFDKGLMGMDMLIPEHRQKAAEVIAKIIGGEEGGLNEYTAQRKDGSTFPVLIRSTPITREGRPFGIRGIIIDVSEKKELQAQLLQVQKMEAIGTLAGGIAHDFNNILMGIQACTSLMLMDLDPSHSHTEHLTGIENYIGSAAELTKQLLGLARGGKYEVKPIDLNQLLQKTTEMFGRTRKEIQISTEFDEALYVVEADRNQIETVFLNIFLNAWQAMAGGGDLWINTSNTELDQSAVTPHDLKPGRYAKISIADTGVGIDEATQKRIFDPFFTTKEIGRGTGMGLASAYGIVKNHGGFIEVYSRKGQGSTFSIFLPAAESEGAFQEQETVEQTLLTGQETILLIDDEKMILDVAKLLMEKLGYKVLVARRGEEAVEIYQADCENIDLVILDLIMPDMSGAETYDRLTGINPNLKVLLASGYSIDDRAKELLARGCQGFIQKPFTVHEISQKLRSILGTK